MKTLVGVLIAALACGAASAADQYLFLGKPSGRLGAGIGSDNGTYDSDGSIRYVCYDASGTIETIITQQGHDARLPSCPAGDTALASEAGTLGDHVSAGQIESPDGVE